MANETVICGNPKCKKEFTPKTARATKFCSDSCRVTASREAKKNAGTPIPVLPKIEVPKADKSWYETDLAEKEKLLFRVPLLPEFKLPIDFKEVAVPKLKSDIVTEAVGPLPKPNSKQEDILNYWARKLFATAGNNMPFFVKIMEREIAKLQLPKPLENTQLGNRARLMQEAPPGTNAWAIRHPEKK